VKIGVIGMAGDYGNSIIRSHFSDLGYAIKPDFDYVNALARELEADGRCDATILLVHDSPIDVAEDLGENTAIDLLLGGHIHKKIIGRTAWGLWYTDPSCDGKAYAYAELAFECPAEHPEFMGVENARIHLTDADPEKLLSKPGNAEELDAAVVQLTDEVVDSVSDFLSSEIGYITQPILRFESLPNSRDRSSNCGNWVASIFARAVDADVGFMNAGGLRIDLDIEPGENKRTITLGDLYKMFPSENSICCYELTWEELLTALEYAITPGGKILLTDVVGVDCYFTGESINALVTPDGEAVYVNGIWKEGWKDKKLRVALNEYIATTNRNRGDEMPNPFVAWYDTPRLIDNSETDIDGAIRVLVREAAGNEGLLSVDTAPHFIDEVYRAE
jgi:2',3'-cyclic-nucleotide 2'-phosphodiesterase (5'-nucleotidase family)